MRGPSTSLTQKLFDWVLIREIYGLAISHPLFNGPRYILFSFNDLKRSLSFLFNDLMDLLVDVQKVLQLHGENLILLCELELLPFKLFSLCIDLLKFFV